MATKAEIVYNISELIRGGASNGDDPVNIDQLAFQVDYYRALLGKRDLDKRKSLYSAYGIDETYLQNICVEMELVDRSLCPDDITLESNIARSVKQIPKTVECNHWNGLVFVGSIDGSVNFQQTTSELAHWQKYAKFTKMVDRYYIIDRYIYQTYDTRRRWLHVRGFFENPDDASHFAYNDGTSCYDLDDDYPIPSWMIQPLTELLLSKEYNIVLRTNTDTLNDRSGEIHGKTS